MWTGLIYVLDILTLSPTGDRRLVQGPLIQPSIPEDVEGFSIGRKPPKFRVPKNPQSGDHFTCSYPKMHDFVNCHSPEDRSCWLKSRDGTKVYDINSNYEILEGTPKGIVRKVRTNPDAPLA